MTQCMFVFEYGHLFMCVHLRLFYFPSSSSTIKQTYTLKSIYHNNALGWTMQKCYILYSRIYYCFFLYNLFDFVTFCGIALFFNCAFTNSMVFNRVIVFIVIDSSNYLISKR